MNVFRSSSILLPQDINYEKWSVVACDQFSSQPRYWNRVRRTCEGYRSVMHMILPDADLEKPRIDDTIRYVNETMEWYINDGIFRQYDNAYVYVERRLPCGKVRAGLLGEIDLEAYDYHNNSISLIRPSEKIVEERLPSRVKIRRDAMLEFPHVQLVCDDIRRELIEPFAEIKDQLPMLYDFDLMEDGGHLTGWLVQGEAAEAFDARLDRYASNFYEKYEGIGGVPMLFAVGEGNLSMAAAKKAYEELKSANPDVDYSNHPARYALAELENLYDPALHVERVHRVVTGTNAKNLLMKLQTISVPGGFPVQWCIGTERGVVYLDRNLGHRDISVLQDFLDDYLGEHPGRMDYIVGARNVEELAYQKNAIGFLLPKAEKESMFPDLVSGGIFPRKSFDLCDPNEMRYYLEGRKIK